MARRVRAAGVVRASGVLQDRGVDAYHPFSDQIMRDPHPVYRWMRSEQPVCYVEQYDCWALARFEDVWNAAQDPATFSSQARGTTSSHLLTHTLDPWPALNMTDPPRHTALRAAVSSRFGPAAIARLEPRARTIVRERLQAVRDRGEFDVVSELGAHLSTGMICHALGLPDEDGEALRGWVDAVFKRDPGNLSITSEGLAAYASLDAYFRRSIASRRKKNGVSGDDVLSRFLAFEAGNPALEDTVASYMSELIVAGTETFPKVLASTLLLLSEHPEQRRLVLDDPGLVLDAFHEALRLDMPTQFMGRTIMRDLDLRGEKLRAGQPVLFLYASANRDEVEFPEPDRFDLRRRPPRMLGFGHGTHACLGRQLARLEARVALEEILALIPDYEVDLTRAVRIPTEFVQGWSRLPLMFSPR